MKSKVTGGVVFVLAIVIGAGLNLTFSNINSLIAGLIEKYGCQVVGTPVTVSGVEIKIRDGSGAIDNLSIANPTGYSNQAAFSLGNITLDIDIESLRQEPIIIDEIRISAPLVNAEFNQEAASNINDLRKAVQDYIAPYTVAGRSAGSASGDASESSDEAKLIRIKKFTFEKGKIEIDASALGAEKQTIDLPKIELTNIGGAAGALPDQIAKEVVTAMAKKAASEIARSEAKKLLEEHLGGSLEEKAKGILDKLIK